MSYIQRNRELDKIYSLVTENGKLKRDATQRTTVSVIGTPKEPIKSPARFLTSSYYLNSVIDHESKAEMKRLRSLVLVGVPEQRCAGVEHFQYDCKSAVNVLTFLDIEYNSVSVYRVGRHTEGKNRLLKIVLSVYQGVAHFG